MKHKAKSSADACVTTHVRNTQTMLFGPIGIKKHSFVIILC